VAVSFFMEGIIIFMSVTFNKESHLIKHHIDMYIKSLFDDEFNLLLHHIKNTMKSLQPVSVIVIKRLISNLFDNKTHVFLDFCKHVLINNVTSHENIDRWLDIHVLEQNDILMDVFEILTKSIRESFKDFKKQHLVQSKESKKHKSLLQTYQKFYQQYHNYQRFIHIWVTSEDTMHHIIQPYKMAKISFETLVLNKHQEGITHYILPEPEDVIVLENWDIKFINNRSKQYVLWLSNDALMTHIKHIPRHLEVVVDLDLIIEEFLLSNSKTALKLHQFNEEIAPILREIHQYLRIKKMKHYLVGNVLKDNQILYRCLTLGFRHIIIQSNDICEAILEAQTFIEPRYLKKI
jgi:hypothetical protein